VFTTGDKNFHFKDLHFATEDGEIQTLTDAYSRYRSIMFPHVAKDNGLLFKVNVVVTDRSESYPQLETDESYTLDIANPADIKLSAVTIYGALRGLETLSQLVIYDFDSSNYFIPATPIHIEDAPRYNHRGLLLDTSRHFQPISFLKLTIDSLAYGKYNVLHWHVVDTQSFPFESISYPKLWKGAYTVEERYSQEDMKELVEYGRQRGVKVMIEFDMPGHAASWCAGYPEICPSVTCLQPLNPASNLTFSLIESLLSECTGHGTNHAGLFPYNMMHLGGDEVSYSCWEKSKEITAWESANGFSGSEGAFSLFNLLFYLLFLFICLLLFRLDTYKYFVDRAATIVRNQKYTPVQWVEVFEHFGDKLDKNTIVHVWKEKSTLDGVLQAGYRAFLSNQDDWYLE
jgi:hexosaminidase